MDDRTRTRLSKFLSLVLRHRPEAIDIGLGRKPARHDFRIEAGSAPAVARHMSVTGG